MLKKSYIAIIWWFFTSDITLPVLPQGLQIMADQGFEHNDPVIVLPRANQPQLSRLMRRYSVHVEY